MRKLCKTQSILLICARFQAQNKCPRITKPDDFAKDAVSIPSESCDLLYRFSRGLLQNIYFQEISNVLPPKAIRKLKLCYYRKFLGIQPRSLANFVEIGDFVAT